MPQFAYRALTESGRAVAGEIEAGDRQGASSASSPGADPDRGRAGLGRPGDPGRDGGGRQGGGSGGAALTLATRELATLLAAGETLESALALVAEEVETGRSPDPGRGARQGAGRVRAQRGPGGRAPALLAALCRMGARRRGDRPARRRAGGAADLREPARRRSAASSPPHSSTRSSWCSPPSAPSPSSCSTWCRSSSRLRRCEDGCGHDLTILDNALARGERADPGAGAHGRAAPGRAGSAAASASPCGHRLVLRLPGLARCRERATPEICRGLATLLKGGLDLPSALLMLRDMVETSRSARRSAAPPRRSARAGG